MPRKPAAGLRWVSIEIAEDDYKILKEAAARDRRSLSMFLRIALGELATDLELKNLVRLAEERDKEKAAATRAAEAKGENNNPIPQTDPSGQDSK